MSRHRRLSARWGGATLLGFTLLCSRAGAKPPPVVTAVNANNVAALEALSGSALAPSQRSLAAGALLALRHEDANAVAVLTPVTRSAASLVVRASAYLALSNVYLRDQRYRACYSAIRAASRLSPRSVPPDYRQTMAFVRVLTKVKPMRLVRETPGALPVTDEKAGMIRVPVRIDGHRRGAMIDTGANYSVITASNAKRVGIKMLNRSVSLASPTDRAVASRIGIAPRLQLGNATFTNVVFIVLPDSKLSIPRRYRIGAIIGLPVLMALGRLELVNSHTPMLFYGSSRDRPSARTKPHANMMLDGLDPLVLVRVPGAANPLLMELDTGSDITYFAMNATAKAPALFAHAKQHVWRVGGAGRIVTEHRALRLPRVTLTVAGQQVLLKNVMVSSRPMMTKSGVLGEDALRLGVRWTIDFKAMTLAVRK